jgi:prepilin-type N-terminal cleavage/methylation domain-containing protein
MEGLEVNTMRQANRQSGGFTLIELMVAVALIGILSATAIASFQLYQLRSKRSEAFANLAALRTTQLSYFHEAGGFVPALQSPGLAGYPGPDKANWMAGGGTFAVVPGAGFDVIGWQPEGPTFFDYDTAAMQGANGWYFTAAAYGDTDGDGAVSVFLYVYPDSVGATLPSQFGAFVVPFNPQTCVPMLNTVGQVPATGACGFPNADDY